VRFSARRLAGIAVFGTMTLCVWNLTDYVALGIGSVELEVVIRVLREANDAPVPNLTIVVTRFPPDPSYPPLKGPFQEITDDAGEVEIHVPDIETIFRKDRFGRELSFGIYAYDWEIKYGSQRMGLDELIKKGVVTRTGPGVRRLEATIRVPNDFR
jgi:hypothetical protein